MPDQPTTEVHDLLTITEAADVLRAPSPRSATGDTSAPARRASASAATSSTAATDLHTWIDAQHDRDDGTER